MDSESIPPTKLYPLRRSIFEDDKVAMEGKGWRCLWCDKYFPVKNATKALLHVRQAKSNNQIAPCPAVIPPDRKRRYEAFHNRKETHSVRRSDAVIQLAKEDDDFHARVQDNHDKASYSASSKKQRTDISQVFLSQTAGGQSVSPITNFTNRDSGMKRTVQMRLTDTHNPEAAYALNLKIADMVGSLALPHSITEDPKFHAVLALARTVGSSYKPPSRYQIKNNWIPKIYNQKKQDLKDTIRKKADIFGLSFYGDGATIRRKALINVMVACASNIGVLDIVDNKNHLEGGNPKDAMHIKDIFLPHLRDLDPDKTRVDVVYFDGASNMQRGGRLLQSFYPRTYVCHGAEHVVSLFFNDICKHADLSPFIDMTRQMYTAFGSGTMHKEHAIFQKYVELHNGRYIGLLRAAETRMAGYLISLQRLYRLQDALIATVTSQEFVQMRTCANLRSLILDSKFWNTIKVLVDALVHPLRILRLADSNEPAMDRVYYLKKLTDTRLAEVTEKLNCIRKGEDLYSSGGGDFITPDEVRAHLRKGRSSAPEQATRPVAGGIPEDGGLGAHVMASWRNRCESMINDLAIAAWMLSPVPEIRQDVKDNMKGEHKDALERVLVNWFRHEVGGDQAEREMIEKFWEEFDLFRFQEGPHFGTHSRIWQSTDLHRGESHTWHLRNTYDHTEWLGKLACRLCSKILGIGSAERNWGDVKRVLSEKRSHMGSDTMMQQVTLYGSYCVAKSKSRTSLMRAREEDYRKSETSRYSDDMDWNEDDFTAFDEANSPVQKTKARRIIRCFIEEWEAKALQRKEDGNALMISNKYKGLQWCCPESNQIFTISDSVVWQQRRGNSAATGYFAFSTTDSYDPRNGATFEHHLIKEDCALHTYLYNFYKNNMHDDVVATRPALQPELQPEPTAAAADADDPLELSSVDSTNSDLVEARFARRQTEPEPVDSESEARQNDLAILGGEPTTKRKAAGVPTTDLVDHTRPGSPSSSSDAPSSPDSTHQFFSFEKH
jgi:hypothetical protein